MTQQSSAKTGGNRKSASQSDLNYWARAKASGYATTHKARVLKRHLRRMEKKAAHRAAWEARRIGKKILPALTKVAA